MLTTAVICCLLLNTLTGLKPSKWHVTLLALYLEGLATEADVVRELNKPDRTGVKTRAKDELWKKLGSSAGGGATRAPLAFCAAPNALSFPTIDLPAVPFSTLTPADLILIPLLQVPCRTGLAASPVTSAPLSGP